MPARDDFLQAVAAMETSLANLLARISEEGTPADAERLLKLIIKKEMLLDFMIQDFPDTPGP